MWTVMVKASRVAGFALVFAHALDARAEPDGHGAGYLAYQQWLHAADLAANDSVTHEICGWGTIDLRTPFLSAAIKQGVDVTAWHELAKRYDDAARERRRTEAVLTAHGANAPMQRTSGLYATGGCTDVVRERIERWVKGAMASATLQPTK